MVFPTRVLRALVPALLFVPLPSAAQQQAAPEPVPVVVPAPAALPAPKYAEPNDPWIFRGTDIPIDKEWLFGELPNGLRYAVRRELLGHLHRGRR